MRQQKSSLPDRGLTCPYLFDGEIEISMESIKNIPTQLW